MKPPVFGLVFNPNVWMKVEDFKDAEIYDGHSHSADNTTRSTPAATLPGGHGLRLKRKAIPSVGNLNKVARKDSQRKITLSVAGDSDAAPDGEDSDDDIVLKSADASSDDGDGSKSDNGDKDSGPDAEEKEDINQVWSTTTIATVTRERVTNPKVSMVRQVAATVSKFPTPLLQMDFEAIRQGFVEGGVKSTDKNSKSSPYVFEQINFHDLPQPTFADLIAEPTKLRQDMLGPDAEIFEAQIRYDPRPEEYLGVGSFKTTMLARLTFKSSMHFPYTGLGMMVQQSSNRNEKGRSMSVALKRPYREKRGTRGGIARLAYAEEELAIFEECKLLVWANSLLKVAYDFMSHFMVLHPSQNPPPFKILEFRFVAAGMAIAQKPLDNAGPSPTTNRAAYLLKEVLPGVKTDFVKYLHNASAVSDLSPDDPDYQHAEFLMFIQHVQYVITGGVAYVSDFQGVGTCLTDPQILTSPQLGNDLFGDGNLGEAFNQFPIQHRCNEYCQWFELESPSEIAKKGESAAGTKKSKGKKRLLPAAYDSDEE